MSNNDKAVAALRAIVETVTEAVNASPSGLPSGHLYATLMGFGCSLSQYESLIGALVKVGKIRKQGHLLLPA